MLLNRETLEGIRAGTITLVFRRWKRPTVKTGGSLLTAVGRLEIKSVDPVDAAGVTGRDAKAAGFCDLASLRAFLDQRPDGDVYRVRLGRLGPDPRKALRDAVPAGSEIDAVVQRLERLDARSRRGAWTRSVLELIAKRPGVRAGDLACDLGRERDEFKVDVRKLKSLGLTESLEVGYRLSKRGTAVLRRLKK